MIDPAYLKPVEVKDDPTGPYIHLSAEVVDRVVAVLKENDIPHWVSHHRTSFNGRPPVTDIYIKKNVDVRGVQDVLDAVE